MKHLKYFENKAKNNVQYKVGDYVKCRTEEHHNAFFGKIINGVTEKDYDDDATTFFTILTENGETTSVWQTEFEGEILGYWDMNDEDFEILVHTNKYNI